MKQKHIVISLVLAAGLMLSVGAMAASSIDFRFVNFRWWVNFAQPTIDPCGTVTVAAKAHHDTRSTEARAAVLTMNVDGQNKDVMRKWVAPKGSYSTTATFKGSCTPGTHNVEFTACVVGIGGNLNKCSSQPKKFTLTYTVKQPPAPAQDCADLGMDITESKTKFEISDITELGRRLLKISTEAGKDINKDGKFDIADVSALDQCYLCLWDWKECPK